MFIYYNIIYKWTHIFICIIVGIPTYIDKHSYSIGIRYNFYIGMLQTIILYRNINIIFILRLINNNSSESYIIF